MREEGRMERPDDWIDLTDRSLLRRFRDGQGDAATALYLRYAQRLQRLADSQTDPRIALQVDPEGIVQSVFRTFFRRVSDGHYDVIASDELWKLFLVIALNKIRNTAAHHRAAKRNPIGVASLDENMLATVGEQDQQALVALRLTIQEILQEVPEAQRRIVLLRIEGFEVQEIADQVGRSKRSVERLLQEFRNRLRAVIEPQ